MYIPRRPCAAPHAATESTRTARIPGGPRDRFALLRLIRINNSHAISCWVHTPDDNMGETETRCQWRPGAFAVML